MPIRDIIIIGAGPSALFCALHLPSDLKILLLEKTEMVAQKLLMSAKWRGNLTNIHITSKDYVTDDEKFVEQSLQKYWSKEFLSFLEQYEIPYHEEAGGRILLDSWKVKEFQMFLLNEIEKKGIQISYNQDICSLKEEQDSFQIKTVQDQFWAKKVILATGSSSIPSVGSSDIALKIAKEFHLKYSSFYPALVGLETEKDVSSLSGSSLIGKVELYDDGKLLYQQTGPILFTHRWVSGPTVFNASLFLKNTTPSSDILFKIKVDSSNITKRFLVYLGFKTNKLPHYMFTTKITQQRPFSEAKVCWGGIATSNLTPNFESKTVSGLYCIGECVEVTGKTGGYNLQRCRTSAHCCSQSF